MRLQPADDEVEASHLVTAEEAKDEVMNRKLKPMSVFVMIDFFLHHGILTCKMRRAMWSWWHGRIGHYHSQQLRSTRMTDSLPSRQDRREGAMINDRTTESVDNSHPDKREWLL
jgi:hypothetical protein